MPTERRPIPQPERHTDSVHQAIQRRSSHEGTTLIPHDEPPLSPPTFLAQPLLAVFDVPMPTTTRGARDVSTTHAQSIALMNSPMVIKKAEAWARAHTQAKPEEALRELFRRAFTREPGTSELNEFVRYSPNLSETAHLLINLKEFIFVP